MFKNSIFGKIFGSLILTLFLSGTFFIFISLRQQNVKITENLINRSLILAKIASKQTEISYQDKTLPFEIFKALSSESEDVVFLWLTKPDGEIYFANDPEVTMGKRIKEPFLGAEKTLVQDWAYPQGVEKIKLIVQPVEIRDEAGKPWSLLMGVSLRSVVVAERAVLLNSLALFVVTFFIAIFISFYLTKKITNPMEKLKQGAEIIGRGNLDYQIEVKTIDEVGKLAETFNKMTDELRISQEALKEELERAKELDRMKTEFISIAAHQLRTPLSAVKWTLRMFIDGDLGPIDSEQKTFLMQGYQSNERMIRLVNDLLNVARIEEGKFNYEFTLVNFEDLIEGVISETRHLIDKKKLSFTYEKPEHKLSKIRADVQKIRLVLQNLVDNAIKYTPSGGQVTISLKNVNMKLEFKIRDSGIGIPAASIDKLFTKFYRSENAVRTQTEGTGLGLFIVKNIVEKHGGKVWAESVEGKGSAFGFSLPIRQKA